MAPLPVPRSSTRAAVGRQQVQRPVHQRLGVVARVEHARIDLQRQAVKGLGAGQVGHRLAAQRRAHRASNGRQRRRQRIAVVRDQPGALVRGAAQRVQQQHLRVDARQACCCAIASAWARCSLAPLGREGAGSGHLGQATPTSALQLRHLLGLVRGLQRVDDVLQIALHHQRQLVQREVDAVVGHAPCGKL
jgi:hypothetical protein